MSQRIISARIVRLLADSRRWVMCLAITLLCLTAYWLFEASLLTYALVGIEPSVLGSTALLYSLGKIVMGALPAAFLLLFCRGIHEFREMPSGDSLIAAAVNLRRAIAATTIAFAIWLAISIAALAVLIWAETL